MQLHTYADGATGQLQSMDSGHIQNVPSTTPVDCSLALRWADGDRSLLAEITETFVEDCPQRMKELELAVWEGNANLIRQVSHSLKGMVSCFGAHQAKSLAQEMEHLGRSGEVSEAAALLPRVVHELSHMIEHLKKIDWQIVS
ncbi:MAG: Hpt domain-containing protein [Nitrospira sp.]|nr:Hpt domain-containing protein [Nitrospira sp.]